MEPYTIPDRIKIIQEYYRNGEKLANTHRALSEYFGGKKNCPAQTTIRRLVTKFEATGSVEDLPVTGRPKNIRTQSNIDAVRESVRTDPDISVACRSQKLGIPQSSLRRIMQNDLNLRAVITTNMKEIENKNDQCENDQHDEELSDD